MLFSVNQASHLYVVKSYNSLKEVVENIGDIVVKTTDDNQNLYFSYMGEGGPIRTDLIPIKNIMHKSFKEAGDLKTELRKAVVTINTDINDTPVAGQDYLLRIKYSIGSIDNQYLKYGVARATKGMSLTKLYETLCTSLENNFAREAEPMFEFTSSANGIEITELEPKWVLGTYPQRPIEFEVSVDTIEVDGIEGPWGNVVVEGSKTYYPNSKKIADFEWFCMGERGDQYKNYGWPNIIPTKYMVDPTNTDGYAVLNIHYSYVGSNESVQKSEKDIFLVGSDANIEAINTAIEAAITPEKTDEETDEGTEEA